MGGVEQPVLNHAQHRVLESTFSEEVDGWRLSGHQVLHHIEVLRGAQVVRVVAEQNDRIAGVPKRVTSDVFHVIQDTDHADDGLIVIGAPQGALPIVGEVRLGEVLHIGTGVVVGDVALDEPVPKQVSHGDVIVVGSETHRNLCQVEFGRFSHGAIVFRSQDSERARRTQSRPRRSPPRSGRDILVP